MQTEIYAKPDHTPSRFYSDAEGRIRRALRHRSRRLTMVRVFLTDEKGPGGAAGTRCRVVLDTGRSGSVVATGRGSDADAALYDALLRVRDRLRRREQRRASRVRGRAGRRVLRKAA
jgi:hypothetical protein